jgi:uncharacterized protein (TIGR03545 family)
MRWKYFIPTIVITAAIIIFNLLFLDMLLKMALVSGGEAVFKARVEVGSLKTKFSNLSINITELKIASSSDPWKNMFEVGRVNFGLKPVPLLSKKFIIENLSVEGVKWGTKRDTSGALPPRKLEKLIAKEKKADKNSLTSKLMDGITAKAKSEFKALPPAGELKSAQEQMKGINFDKAVNVNDLESVKAMDAMKSEMNAKFAQYDADIKNLNTDEKVTLANNALNDIKSIKISGVQDIEPAKKKLDQLSASTGELQKAVSDIQALKTKLDGDMGAEKDMLAKINELKDKDYKALADKYKIPSFDFGNISQALFGPVWIGRVNSAIYYMHLARKYMPPRKKTDTKVVSQRMKGRDVYFPKHDNPPAFLVQQALLTGTSGGPGKEGVPMDFKGQITDITSDPAMLGRPTVGVLNGAQGKQALNLKAVLDHTKEIPEDSVAIDYSGLDIKSFGLPSSDYMPAWDKGQAKVVGVIKLNGDAVDASINTVMSGLNYTAPKSVGGDEMQKALTDMWAGINTIEVKVALSGTMDNLKMSVSSSIDKVLSDRMKKITGEKLAEYQAKLRAQIDNLTNGKKNEVMGQYTAKKDEYQKQLTAKQAELQSKSDEIKKQIADKQKAATGQVDAEKNKAADAAKAAADAEKAKAQAAVDAEKAKAQAAADAEKKKQEEELKKQAQDKLKDMFK